MDIPVGAIIKIERAGMQRDRDREFRDQQRHLFSLGFRWTMGGEDLQDYPQEYNYLEILDGKYFGYRTAPSFEKGLWELKPIFELIQVEQKFINVAGNTYDLDDVLRLLGEL